MEDGNWVGGRGQRLRRRPADRPDLAAGETTKTVAVTVNSDTVDEDDERLQVLLSLPVGATIADDAGIAIVVDDDPTTALSVNDVIQFDEEAAGALAAEFTITRSGDTSGPSSVTWSTPTTPPSPVLTMRPLPRPLSASPPADHEADLGDGDRRRRGRGEREVPGQPLVGGECHDRRRERIGHDHRLLHRQGRVTTPAV
jgi:hypothetical protein